MIDFTKINNLPVSFKEILSHPKLTFTHSNVATTGEVINRAQVAQYGSMDFVVKGGNVKLKGSYHKHAQGGTNHKDFTFPAIRGVIDELTSKFHFDPKDAHFNFIEIGVNIPVSTDPTSLIKNFLLYNHKPFEPLIVNGAGYGRQCRLQQFTIKIYSKSLQYGLPFHLLRFEVKVTRMTFLQKYGIDRLTMDDLRKPEVYAKLLEMLLDVLHHILLFNPDFNIGTIQSRRDRELVLQGRFPEYWKDLPRQRKSEQIKRFTELTGANRIKEQLKEQISLKWQELMTPDKLTTFQKEQENAQPDKLTTFINQPKIHRIKTTGQINPTINSYSPICPVTGIDISMQKPGSLFLSISGLRWLHDNDPEKYDKVRRRYLPRWAVSGIHTKYEVDEVSHLAKQIRNEYHNPRRKRKHIPTAQLELF